ncbi:hypothetical protein ACWF9G_00230 [Nocardia sp. NPDC055029]|uniref:hypothetical protein n=1 Tax=Nocardia sp. NPDC060259 TaxID=3347088 RepID=UPI003647FC34
MKQAIVAAARVAAAGFSGIAAVAIIGSGSAQAAPQDCVVQRDLFGASATCPPGGGDNYVLKVECVGLYANGPFPLYGIGPYSALSYPFAPAGQRVSTGCTGMGPGVVAVATNAYVIYYG